MKECRRNGLIKESRRKGSRKSGLMKESRWNDYIVRKFPTKNL